jgi:hypothetical protein
MLRTSQVDADQRGSCRAQRNHSAGSAGKGHVATESRGVIPLIDLGACQDDGAQRSMREQDCSLMIKVIRAEPYGAGRSRTEHKGSRRTESQGKHTLRIYLLHTLRYH